MKLNQCLFSVLYNILGDLKTTTDHQVFLFLLFLFFGLVCFVLFSLYVSLYVVFVTVPGDGGSQLFAKLDRPSVPHYYCTAKTSGYFNIWLNMEEFTPFPIDCFVDNMR